MELRFLFNEYSSIQIPSTKVTFDAKVNYLLELNKMHMTSLCMTLVRKNVVEDQHENSDGGDHNINNFCDTVESYENDEIILKMSFIIMISLYTRNFLESS